MTYISVKRHRVLVADPPWKPADKLPGRGRGAQKHYAVLSLYDICQFPLPWMDNDSMLLLWRIACMQEEALQVVRAWGFVPKSEIVWRKQTKTGKRHFGMGHYVRAEHETCIVATRGRFKVDKRNVRSTFEAPTPVGFDGRTFHSAKPPEFFEIVETLAKGPYAELFARERRAGWSQWGRDLPGGEPHP